MGSLIKTGKVVKVDPRDIINLYRMIRTWVTLAMNDDYLNFLREEAKEDSNFYTVFLTTNLLLVPKYMYSEIPRILKNNTKVQHRDKIEYEKFSYFNVYRFDNKSDGEIEKVEFEVQFGPSSFFLERVRIFALKLNIVASEPDNEDPNFYDKVPFKDRSCFFSTLIHENYDDIESFEKDLRTLYWIQGKSYSKFPKRRRGGVVDRIEHIEEHMILFTNFLYTLYTGEFEKNTPGGRLFEPFTKSLKELGDTFENALEGLKFIVILAG
jgi:hypothetical protein